MARVAAQLRDEQLSARRVTLKLRHGDFKTVTRQVTLPAPSDLDQEIREAARALLRAEWPHVERRGKGVRLIGVAAGQLDDAVEPDLFEPPERQRLRNLARALDRVRGKFGFDAVRAAEQVKKR